LKVPNPKNYVVLTFDDGYRDFYTDVLPILQKYNAKATVYLVYNFLDNPNYLYTWQVREIIDSNLVEIGSHTLNHTYLKGMTEEIIVNEINESKFELENAFNIKINSFAYPYGAYNELTAKQVELAGYTNAVTTDLGIISNTNNKFVLKRIRPGYSTGQGLINYLDKLKEN
jgi:peptidoglycan/xylan/chitin deacetylase (PgdA/CDA1 family)